MLRTTDTTDSTTEPTTDAENTGAVIDLDRHPIAGDDAARRELVARCRTSLADDGCVVLDGFVRADALARMADEGRQVAGDAHFNETITNCYSSDDDPTLSADHPRRIFMERTNGFVAADRLSSDLTVRRLYHDDALRRFVADCTGIDVLHEYGDPFGHLVFNVVRPGCQHPWHFDNNDFVVTVLTQRAEAGGVFEYCPGIRSRDEENTDAIGAVLAGDRSPIRELDLQPGSLQIFFGRDSLHRVTRVEGDRERHVLILGYSREPDQIAGVDRTRRLFGRVSDAHRRADANGHSLEAVGTSTGGERS